MTTSRYAGHRTVGLMAVTAAAAAMTATIGVAPPAEATCASFFGLNAGSGCSSSLFSVAIAIGNGATATATGLFGTAISLGDNAKAFASDPFTFGITAGADSTGNANGLFGIAVNLGSKGTAVTIGSGQLGNLGLNIALNVPAPNGGNTVAVAGGIGNIATNLLGSDAAANAFGILNTATNLGGRQAAIYAGQDASAVLNTAFKIGGTGGAVIAHPGPLAIAGSIFQDNGVVFKTGPGININNVFKIGGAAATRHRTPSSVAARGASSTLKPVGATRARR